MNIQQKQIKDERNQQHNGFQEFERRENSYQGVCMIDSNKKLLLWLQESHKIKQIYIIRLLIAETRNFLEN